MGRTTSVTDPLSRVSTTDYEDAHRRTVAKSPAPLNLQTKVTVDNRGQVVRDENALGDYLQPGYDHNGNRVSWRDRRGKVWVFTFDKEDRPETTTSPLNRTTTLGYNARGLLETITEPSGQVTTLGYDGRRRLSSRTDAAGTTIYGLDHASQLQTVTQGTAVLTRTYHPSGEVASFKNATNETITYDYDKNGNLVSLTYPAIGSVAASTVSYEYDSRDRLVKITDWASRVTTYAWDAAGKLVGVTRHNGTKRALRWDAAGQLLVIEERPANGAPLALRSFGYDTAGRITKRLSYPQAAAWSEQALSVGVNDDNQLTGGVLGYDADGNTLTSILPNGPWGATGSSTGALGSFAWNARNQLTQVTRTGGQTVTYTYDAEGNLIQSTDSVEGATRWIIDPNGGGRSRVLAKVAPDGRVTRYIHGVGLVYEVCPDGSTRSYHYDQVGSTIALTNDTGVVTGRADYSPYGTLQAGSSGELANANATPFLFVGAYGVITDPVTGMHHMRARWYSSNLRRFINEDPIGFAGGENFYAYAGGNPVSLIDPSGLAPFGYDTWADYGNEVGQVWVGYGQAGSDTIHGLYNTVAHPITTAQGLYNAATNPGQTADAISQAISDSWSAGSAGQGRVVGHVLLTAATFGATKATSVVGRSMELTEVSRWGRSGLQSGDWVMQGRQTLLNYRLSGKNQRGFGNQFAPQSSGQTFSVPRGDLYRPSGLNPIDGRIKSLIPGQRQFKPGGAGLLSSGEASVISLGRTSRK